MPVRRFPMDVFVIAIYRETLEAYFWRPSDPYNHLHCNFFSGARLWLLLGFVVGFGSLIASIWILFGNFVVNGAVNQWRGVALFLQNFLIFFASLVYKFGRAEDHWA